ncbi:MAG: ArsA family ATPase, partial [Chloroflexota bacterium]
VPLAPAPVQGFDALRRFAGCLAAGDGPARRRGQPELEHGRARPQPRARTARRGSRGGVSALLDDPRRLTIFGGKGGVGKTTLSAATALGLAWRLGSRSVAVLSIDPAHSLGDVLRPAPGAQGAANPLNLLVVEPRADESWDAFTARWMAPAREALAGVGGGRFDPIYDREIVAQLSELWPPGLDELAAATTLVDLLDEDPDRLLVVDAAPTGHLLRFLQSPGLLADWARQMMRLLLKYGLASRLKGLSEELLALSRKARRLDGLLRDPDRCQVVVVATAELPVLAETWRLLDALAEGRIPVRWLVLNQLVAERDTAIRSDPAIRRRLAELWPAVGFVEIERRPVPVQGLAALDELAAA